MTSWKLPFSPTNLNLCEAHLSLIKSTRITHPHELAAAQVSPQSKLNQGIDHIYINQGINSYVLIICNKTD